MYHELPLFADKPSLNRRSFLKSSAVAAAGLAFARLPVMAGPFTREDFDKLVPADKKLRPEWVKSLTARGERAVYRGAELKTIGMPVGGITCGQLYLGGDGRLWHWDVFNQHIGTGHQHYTKPLVPSSPVEQGFALRATQNGSTQMRRLDRSGWNDISFIGEYPIGYVEYRDAGMPVAVGLEAFSPFIPLNVEDSSLPATVIEFTVRNTSATEVEIEFAGWLENAVCRYSGQKRDGLGRTRVVRAPGVTFLHFSAEEIGDRPRGPLGPRAKVADFGTMGLALLDAQPGDIANASLAADGVPETSFSAAALASEAGSNPFGQKLVSSLGRKFKLAPGKSAKVTFVLAWHFPNLTINGVAEGGRFYATKFDDAAAVVRYIAGNFDRLASTTRLWREVWHDSTLPHWFLDRTQLNTSILATSTCFRFASGRFWAWEGVGCCPGTCGHVWQYAQGMARQFPELERIVREGTDFGLALQPGGAIHFRGENNNFPAIDAQAGAILRALREHQTSADDAFLRRVWPGVKRATDWLIAKDGDGDGIIESNQHNTLDTDWFGPVAWLSGLYLAALAAAAALAGEMGDAACAEKCRAILARGQKKFVTELFDGDYFINRVDPKHLDAVNSGTGCEIDQVMGQSWAFQVGLPRVLPEKETRAALQSLWKYNFSPDVGPYRARYKSGRWYALAGEAGLLMCSFPRKDWDYEQARGEGKTEWAAGYFNECMTGFEHQVAGHMVWEGMLTEGLAIERAVHDRYHPSRRNPWNEVECGDHYARSMASYGVFIAACGFEHHGPKARIGFAPRLTPEDFKAPFTAAEGWGTFSQRRTRREQANGLGVKWGKLRLKTLAFELPQGVALKAATVAVGPKVIPAQALQTGQRVEITLTEEITLRTAESLRSKLMW